MSNEWWAYVQQRTTGSTQKAISDETGVEQTVLSRWKLGRNRPEAQSVVEFARAIHRPPTEALVAAGYLRAAEVAASIEVVRPLTDLSDDDLLAEVRRRMTGARNDLTTQATTTSGPTPTEGEKNGAGNPRESDEAQPDPLDLAADNAAAHIKSGQDGSENDEVGDAS